MTRQDTFRAIVRCRPMANLAPFVRVTIIRTSGSTPREAGAAMNVFANQIEGTIGGGRLEFEAIAHARRLLPSRDVPMHAARWARDVRSVPLGPALAQCCGGRVDVLYEAFGPAEIASLAQIAQTAADNAERPDNQALDGELWTEHPLHAGPPLRVVIKPTQHQAARKHSPDAALAADAFAARVTPAHPRVFIYGAGHVGRALVAALAPLPLTTFWVDTAKDRFPDHRPAEIQRVIAADPALFAKSAPGDALHVIMTYSHSMDLAICHALLAESTARFVGVIGSQTKAARFRKRLAVAGVSEEALATLVCPIGIPGLTGKEPEVIAASVAAQLLTVTMSDRLST